MHPNVTTPTGKTLAPRFVKIGGFWHPQLSTPEDLRVLLEMEAALWVANSSPVDGLHFDAATLVFIDTDGNRRIRYEELRTAVSWYFKVLKSMPAADDPGDVLALNDLNCDTAAGREIHAAAVRVLANTGRADATEIRLSDVMDRKRVLSAAGSNGDGVITPESVVDDGQLMAVIDLVMKTVGSVPDLSGQRGVNAEIVNTFYRALKDYLAWWDQGWSPDTSTTPNLSVFTPENLEDAAAAFRAVRAKLDEYFVLSEIVHYDERAAAVVNGRDAAWAGLAGQSPEDLREVLSAGPLAPVSGAEELSLTGPVNPVFAPALLRFRDTVWRSLFPVRHDTISRTDWDSLKRLFDRYEQRLSGKPGTAVEGLGVERMRALLADDDREKLLARIVRDIAAAAEIAAVTQVEKLLRFKRHLLAFANNYVAFPDFYDVERKAAFEAGTLVMDGRLFRLCVHVEHQAEHATIAARSGIYLMYCDLSRYDSGDKRRVAVAVTAGGTGSLYVGKRGVFSDREGRDWDARVAAIIENPISLSEALWAPFKRLGSMVSSQIEKLTTAREKNIEKEFDTGFNQMAQAVDAGPVNAAPSPAAPVASAARPAMGGYGGMVVGGSVAVAALGSSFAFISKTFSEIGRINFLYTAAVILLIILLPTLVQALLRLRARDIGKILEACGWAINGRMRLNMRLARILSYTPSLPPGARKAGGPAMYPSGWLRAGAASRRRLRLLLALLATAIAFCLLRGRSF